MRKIYKALAIMTAIVTTFSACGKNSDNASVSNAGEYVADTNLNAPGEFPVCKNKITLKIGIPKDPLVTDYDTNLYTQAIKDGSEDAIPAMIPNLLPADIRRAYENSHREQ